VTITNIFDTGYTNHIDADVHPNGKSIYLAINKTESKNRVNYYNLKIVEVDRATRKVVRIIREYNQGVQTPGPVGYCTVKCLPDGALFVGLAITSTKDSSQVVAAIDIIENIIPVFTPGSTNTTNPTPTSTVDQTARDSAYQALAAAAGVKGDVKVLNTTLTQSVNTLNAKIAALPTKDYVWQNIADRIALEIQNTAVDASSVFESPLFIGFVKARAQEVLLDAIQYAKANPTKSALYGLIQSAIQTELSKK